MAAKLRFTAWIVTVVSSIVGTTVWLILIRGARIMAHDWILMGGWIGLTTILLVIALLLKTTPPNSIKLAPLCSRWIILTGTILLHVCAIATLWPALSDDLVRYRFDGRTWLTGRSPYVLSPAEIENLSADDRGYRLDSIDRAVTYPILHTIYPPMSQVLFTATAGIERVLDLAPPPAAEWSGEAHPQWRKLLADLPFAERGFPWRIVSSLSAIGCVFAVLALLDRATQSPWWAVLFAWNPLVLIESAGMAHQDSFGVLLVALMLLAHHRARYAVAAMLLALAVGVKPIVILVLPFLLRDAAMQRAFLRTTVAFIMTALLLALPLLYHGGLSGMLLTGRIYSQNWEANGSVYEMFKTFFGDSDVGHSMVRAKEMSRLLSVTMTLLTGLILWQSRATLVQAAYWFFLILLICAPVVYPWYLLWILCLLPMLRGPQGLTGLVWSGTVSLSYLLWHTSDWQMPHLALLWEYVPVGVVLLLELLALSMGTFARREPGSVPLAV